MAHRFERDNDVVRSVNFAGDYTGKGPNVGDGSGFNRIAEFETGFVSSMGQRTPVSSGDASLYFGMPEYAAFVSDSWNATSKLTVDIGLRYDLPIPAYSVNNYWGVLDQSYPGWRMVMPGLTPGTNAHPFSADKKDFAPRLGMAYRLTDKTVIRGGYGIFYESGRFKFLDQMFWNSPGYGGSSYNSASMVADPAQTFYTIADTFPAAITVARGTWPLPLGDNAGTCVSAVTPQPRTRRRGTPLTSSAGVWMCNANSARPRSCRIGYVGSEGTHLPIQYDLNLPAQGVYLNSDAFYAARPLSSVAPDRWGAVNSVRTNRSNNYNAMNLELKSRGWHGLTSTAFLHLVEADGQFLRPERRERNARDRRTVEPAVELRSL